MSSDNGVYILKSPSHLDSGGFEYRVAHVMGIDNMCCAPDPEGFNEELKKYFGTSFVFHDRTEALVKADEIAQGCEILEYGIQFISLSFVFPS